MTNDKKRMKALCQVSTVVSNVLNVQIKYVMCSIIEVNYYMQIMT